MTAGRAGRGSVARGRGRRPLAAAARAARVGLLAVILAATSGCLGEDPPWGRATEAARQLARGFAAELTGIVSADPRPSTTWQLAFELRSIVMHTLEMSYDGEFVDAAGGVLVAAVLDHTEVNGGGFLEHVATVRLCLYYYGQVGRDEVTVVGVPCTGEVAANPAAGGQRAITLDG